MNPDNFPTTPFERSDLPPPLLWSPSVDRDKCSPHRETQERRDWIKRRLLYKASLYLSRDSLEKHPDLVDSWALAQLCANEIHLAELLDRIDRADRQEEERRNRQRKKSNDLRSQHDSRTRRYFEALQTKFLAGAEGKNAQEQETLAKRIIGDTNKGGPAKRKAIEQFVAWVKDRMKDPAFH